MGRQFKLQHADNSSLATVLVLTKKSSFLCDEVFQSREGPSKTLAGTVNSLCTVNPLKLLDLMYFHMLSSSFPSLKILPKINSGQSIGLITEAWYAHN